MPRFSKSVAMSHLFLINLEAILKKDNFFNNFMTNDIRGVLIKKASCFFLQYYILEALDQDKTGTQLVQPQEPPLSTKVSFVWFDPADLTLTGDNPTRKDSHTS